MSQSFFDSEPRGYLNGRFVASSQAALPLTDLGFVWGATVTERLRTFCQKLFRLDEHLGRFRKSCEQAYISQPKTESELAAIANELIEVNGKTLPEGSELSLSIFATPGSGTGGPTLGMQATRLEFERYASIIRAGARLEPVACPASVDPAIKHRSRLAWWIASKQVTSGTEPLFTSGEPHHFIRETPIANFLAVIDGELVSPPGSTILKGISLQVVKELAEALGIGFREREITVAEVCDRASECLLTNTSYCLAPVAVIPGKSQTIAGPTFQRLLHAWSELVGVDILGQFPD